jgi:CRP/FNR family transcriptional activator FtrB
MGSVPFDRLMSVSKLETCHPESTLFQEGNTPEFLFVVVEGLIELFSEHGHDDFSFALLRPGSSFIMAAVIRDAAYLNSARALSFARILAIPATDVRAAAECDRPFAHSVEQALAADYRSILKELKDRAFRPVSERLANWLLREMEPEGAGGRVILPFNRRKLAAHIGTTPETLSRVFTTLSAHGVEGHGQEIVLRDIAELSRLAGPDPLIDDPTI